MPKPIFVYVTNHSRREAERIAEHLINKKLIACANILSIESIYKWEGKLMKEPEYAFIAKTTEEKIPEVEEEIKKIHPYQIPCIAKTPVDLNKEYLNWLIEQI